MKPEVHCNHYQHRHDRHFQHHKGHHEEQKHCYIVCIVFVATNRRRTATAFHFVFYYTVWQVCTVMPTLHDEHFPEMDPRTGLLLRFLCVFDIEAAPTNSEWQWWKERKPVTESPVGESSRDAPQLAISSSNQPLVATLPLFLLSLLLTRQRALLEKEFSLLLSLS